LNLSELLIELAVRWGASESFTLPGGMAMHINKAIHDHPSLRNTFMHHEQSVISAAEGYTKSTNFSKFAIASITAGPGVSNSISGLLSAFGDSVPMLVIAGQIKTSDIDLLGLRTHGIQEINTARLVPPAVKTFVRFAADNLNEQLEEIYNGLFLGRLGPVFVEIPLDEQSKIIDEHLVKSILSSFGGKSIMFRKELGDKTVKRLREVVSKSTRISVYIGNGVRIANLEISPLLEILDRLGIPRLYSWLSFDLEDFNNELNMGCPGSLASTHSNMVLDQTDLIFIFGGRLDLASTAFQRDDYAPNATRVIVDVDQLELKKFRRDSDIQINLDLRQGLEKFVDLLKENSKNEKPWIAEIVQAKSESIKLEDFKLASSRLNVRNIALELSKTQSNSIFVPASSGLAEELLTRFFRPNGKSRFFNGAALGSMGHGLAQSIGALRARNGVSITVNCLEGDAGLWMSVQELATLAELNPSNFRLFILNNGGYGSIEASQKNHLSYVSGCNPETVLMLPEWKKVAKIFDLQYFLVTTLKDLILLLEMNEIPSAQIIDLRIPAEENKGPRLQTVMTLSGPKTGQLKEISW
jgi:acetolactate synthase-1/2/3 large subunit